MSPRSPAGSVPVASSILENARLESPELAASWGASSAKWERIEIPSGRVLLREGEISTSAYWVERGCLRLWFMNGKKDITFQFFFEGGVVSSMESFRKGIPSAFTLEAIEPSSLLVISKADHAKMMAKVSESPAALLHLLDAAYERQAHYMRTFMSFIRDKPEVRYRNLLRDEPRLIERVAQRYIASYLGITPVSLSRIRGRKGSRSSPL